MKIIIKKLKRILRGFISVIELILCRYLARSRWRSDGNGRVVIIQDCHIGDFLVALPYFQRLSRFYERKLTLVSDARIVPLAMACGCFEEVVAIDMKRASSYLHLLKRWQTFRRLRCLDCEVLIHKYAVGGTSFEDVMAVLIPAASKFGVESEKTVSNGGCKLYGRLLKKSFDRLYQYDTGLNLLENENRFCNMICGTNETECVGDLECFEPLPDRDTELGKYALFIPGADDPRRRWEPSKFAAVAAKYLQSHPDRKVLFSGSPGEQTIIAEVLKSIPDNLQPQVKVRETETDILKALKRLMSDCRHAEFVLVGETGPLHIAAKYRTKCFCLSGGWHYNIFAPWKEYKSTVYFQAHCSRQGCNSYCIYNTTPFKCLQDTSAEKVWENIQNNI